MLVRSELVIEQESSYVAKTPRGYVGILGETAAREGDILTIELPEDYTGWGDQQTALSAISYAINKAADANVYPYCRKHERE